MKGDRLSSLIQRGRDEAPSGPGEPVGLPLFASAPLPSLSPLGRGEGEGDALSFDKLRIGSSLITDHASLIRATHHGLFANSGEFQIRGLSRLLVGVGGGGSCAAA